ncbi:MULTISPECIES: electron transport complex subunit RsxC [Pantoea]|jgi:electron transport complex protein RnfC|uniref:Ion-translocating oxidoreductase complex subunit C n=1 Tax=Pantoea brenneri TaxID=472694 RepID=A0A7Y6NAX5_9GAMM|nr:MULTISPECIES: electron transport complex subunit RsxC [Pantoea]MBZ6393503.1 electron transport complex subunit RsxC [Pantoea sp.]MBZ6437514.1 electron transport complex subunit RsxC [Pantoea sp.]NUY40232.1 electron transport complex subunit RsxC [Pantoea brenneri]NUY47684.1 electron transport complex subunit RsxC [Pantoea brenneri]NUY58011.1 electron transport complex subunit RsxC [Pantoea brenneri]
MLNLLNFFKKDKIWDFQGGIHPPEMKTQSNGTPLSELPLPHRFIIPLKQHIGHEGEICVAPGDKVLRGQPLTFGTGRMLPVHAPTSGTIEDIGQHMTAHPSGLSELCIFLTPDGEDRWMPLDPLPDYRQHPRADIVQRIHDAGIAGLGGAGFPTATKLKGGLRGVKTLIINAAECEPYITADDRLMQDYAAEVLEGSRILAWVLQAERVLIGIEDNKPEAIAALKQALGGERDLQIRVIPTKYPSGGAKQLTRILTGMEVPHGGRSTDIGVLMQNVGTAWAVKRAIINGEPITKRVVTLTGEAIAQPRNVWSRLGTPISHLLHQVGFRPGPRQMVIMGGPLMGFTLPSLDVPVVKITNCILAPSSSEMGNNDEEQSCIRCSACADACPAKLLPQQLYWYSQGGDHDKARAHHIDDCIECGACAYVCPSNIPLVQYYRQEKAELRAIDLEAKRTLEAKARFEARQARLEREKQAREARHEEAKQRVARSDNGELAAAKARATARRAEPDEAAAEAQREARHAQARLRQAEAQAETQALSRQTTDPRKAAVEAAIARAKAKKMTPAGAGSEASEEAAVDPRKAAVEAAVARAKAKKAAQAESAAEPQPVTDADAQPAAETDDPRKAAVQAAIARAKAKKAAQAESAQPGTDADAQPAAETDDPRKAAVQAAIARAKAKKAAQAESAQPVTDADAQPAAETDDPRKAAVQAAIARAKAKKAAQAESAQPGTDAESQPAAETDDPRKAAVQAAIARAKAKKAAQAGSSAQPVTDAESQPAAETDDPRKAAVQAAIARAKAKKAAQAESAQPVTGADAQPAEETDDPRKAAVQAAIARAKAKKAQAQAAAADAASRDAAVVATQAHYAVEKAEQAQEQANNANAEPEQAPELNQPDDARKAAIAAAIARAKARKAQSSTTLED